MNEHSLTGARATIAFAALTTLALASFGASMLPLHGWEMFVALAIAAAKAAIVGAVFMELDRAAVGYRAAIATCAAFFAIMMALMVADVRTRGQERPAASGGESRP